MQACARSCMRSHQRMTSCCLRLQAEDKIHVRESGDGVSGTQGPPPAPERVHSTCLAQREAQAPAERDVLGHRHVSGVPEQPPQQLEGPVHHPGRLLLVTEASEPCR